MLKITRDYLAKNEFSRPMRSRPETRALIMHYNGNPGGTAEAMQDYFDRLALQDPEDDRKDRYASAHYVVGLRGQTIQMMPEGEVAYHCGATHYTALAHDVFGGYATPISSPNYVTVGIEMCHPTSSGMFSLETLESAAELAAYICFRYNIPPELILRHYDVTGKLCPKYWVLNPDRHREFQEEVTITLRNFARRSDYGEAREA